MAQKIPTSEKVPEPKKEIQSSPANSETRDFWVEEDAFFPKRRVIASFVDDKPHGEARSYDEQGRLIGSEHYDQGVLNGDRVMYYPSGKKYGVTPFKYGKANGTAKVWFDGGELAETFEYVDGVFHGEMVTYYPNGRIMVLGQMVDGMRQGERKHYLPDGRQFGSSYYENNKQIGNDVLFELTRAQYESTQGRVQPGVLKRHWK